MTQTSPAATASEMATQAVDVLVVGAGLSGIGTAVRLERERPGTTYAVLEMRGAIGGTWDLFRFPGIRSDSDMYTFSYPFRPWHGKAMGSGADIRTYIAETAAEFGVEKHIRFHTKVLAASWSSEEARWTVRAATDGRESTWTCRFLFVCSGYYDYEQGYQPDFPGRSDYRGVFVHPQFWPEDLDYSGKRVVVIGSGATAVTLIPALTDKAAHVTMLQRSPSYVMAIPGIDALADVLHKRLPPAVAHRLLRAKNVALFSTVYAFSRGAPKAARKVFRRQAVDRLGDEQYVDTHFKPAYDPWTQRLTIAPDGDFYQTIAAGRASVVTSRIDRFVENGVRLENGEVLEADVVVSATGLSLKALGGIEMAVDGERVDLGESVAYRAVMISGIPNLAFVFGYTNASWTLRADLSARFVVRLLKHMDKYGYASATPFARADGERRPFIDDLKSGYIQRGIAQFPRQGTKNPWRIRQNYLRDSLEALPRNVTRDMRFTRASRPAPSTVTVPVTDGTSSREPAEAPS